MMKTALHSAGLLMALALGAGSLAASGNELAHDCTIEPKKIAKIGSRDEGIIEQILVERGDVVEAGQVLAVLDSRIEALAVDLARLQAQADVDVRAQKARLGFQRSEAERAQTLFKKKAVSSKALDEVMVQEKIARLELESASIRREVSKVEFSLAEAQFNRRTIKSPVNGIVTEVSKAPGEYIHEQTPLLTLAQIESLNVEVFVPVALYGQIELDQKAMVEPVQPIGGQYEAVVDVVDRVFDAASGTFGVRLRLGNPDGALPAGIRCKVRFEP